MVRGEGTPLNISTGRTLPCLALRPKEAAHALGISERTLRQMLPELPHLRVRGVVLLPVEELKEWLRTQAAMEGSPAGAIAAEILGKWLRVTNPRPGVSGRPASVVGLHPELRGRSCDRNE